MTFTLVDAYSYTAGKYRRDMLVVERPDGEREEWTVFDTVQNVNLWPVVVAGRVPSREYMEHEGLIRPPVEAP